MTLALQHVGAIYPGGGDANEQLAVARLRQRRVDWDQHLGRPGFADVDRGHHIGQIGHRGLRWLARAY